MKQGLVRSKFSRLMDTYEGRPVVGFAAWAKWAAQVYVALQFDALTMNIAYMIGLALVFALGVMVGSLALSALAVLVWALMPLVFMGKIRRSFLQRQSGAAGQ